MSKIIFDLDDTLYVSDELRNNREKVILDFLGISNLEFFKLMSNVTINLNQDLKLISLLEKLKEDYKLVILSNSSKFCVKETLVQLTIFVGGFHKDADKSIKNIYELNNFLKGGYE